MKRAEALAQQAGPSLDDKSSEAAQEGHGEARGDRGGAIPEVQGL